MAWYDNPAFGIYQNEEVTDQILQKASFGTPISKNQGDGKWCEKCRENGHYSWMDFKEKYNGKNIYYPCGVCKK